MAMHPRRRGTILVVVFPRIALALVWLTACDKPAPDSAPPEPTAESTEPAAPEPEPEPAEPEEEPLDREVQVEGPLTQEQVQKVVQKNFTPVRECFDAALLRLESEDLLGGISVRIEVDATGTVTDAILERSTFGDAETPDCILEVARTWKFPKPRKKASTTIVYPFFLRSY
jgi:TonB family protein